MSPKKKIFGTDGIRGRANRGNITSDVMLKAGQAAGVKFTRGLHTHKVIIGKDTRLSGYMLENALTAGFVSMGMDVILAGPVPTPAVAMLTKSMRADLGVMISASHNKFPDNGIKFFDPKGFKLSDNIEKELEELMQRDLSKFLAPAEKIGRATRIDDVTGRYLEHIKSTFPKRKTLEGLKIVIDCANGSAYKIGPTVLWELGAEVIAIANTPNGKNINDNCGSTCPELLIKTVQKNKADIGIALDGDADRVVIIDKKGNVIDGDQIIAMIAEYWKKEKKLKGGGVVTTTMSNLGLEKHLAKIQLDLKRTDVGDKYVSSYMKENGYNVGGEQSGHIILTDYSTTGDGLVAALQILALMADDPSALMNFGKKFSSLPQILKNIPVSDNFSLLDDKLQAAIKKSEEMLGANGRVLVRKSGTESLIRVMVESTKISEAKKQAEIISAAINQNINKKNVWKNIGNRWLRFGGSSRNN